MTNEFPMAAPSGTQEPEAGPTGLAGEVFTLVGQVNRRLETIRRWTMRGSGLTPPQFAVLRSLGLQDGQPLKDLAEASRCTRATMTRLVDGLERRELARRRSNPADRRSLLVVLTERGHALLADAPGLVETYAHCCAGLSESEYRRLSGLLRKLDAALDCAGPPSHQAPARAP